jgi:hypothetical protein
MTTATTPMPTMRVLPSHHWHGNPTYPVPTVIAPRTPTEVAPPFYNVLLAHPVEDGVTCIRLPMHQGPELKEAHKGLTMEVLIGLCLDRLTTFQLGPYACEENAAACANLQDALTHLAKRRMRVEGERRVDAVR